MKHIHNISLYHHKPPTLLAFYLRMAIGLVDLDCAVAQFEKSPGWPDLRLGAPFCGVGPFKIKKQKISCRVKATPQPAASTAASLCCQ